MDERVYNPEVKEEFLSTYKNEQTKTTIRYILYKSQPMESMLEKDLYDFNVNEIGKVIKNTNAMTSQVAQANDRFVYRYISWAIEKGLRSDNIHPLAGMEKEWYDLLVSDKKIYMSEEEIDDLIGLLKNAQDAVIIQLLFEGVNGHDSSELCNLHYDDINWDTNTLQLKDDRYGERSVKVSDKCMGLINKAHKQNLYYNRNGTAIRIRERQLIRNDYILRNIKTKRTINEEGVDKHTIYRRLSTLQDLFDLHYLRQKQIEKSGMIKMGKDLFKRDGKLGKEQLGEIAAHFGHRKIEVGDYKYYNTSILKQYINRENILNLYGVDINK